VLYVLACAKSAVRTRFELARSKSMYLAGTPVNHGGTSGTEVSPAPHRYRLASLRAKPYIYTQIARDWHRHDARRRW
jgi:hypothetical protein